MVEVHEEIKDEKRRQRKAAMEDKSNPWVEDDDSAEEAEIDTVQVKKADKDIMKIDENDEEDPLDAYMSSLKNSLVGKSGVEIEKTENPKNENGKVSVVVATRVVATKSKAEFERTIVIFRTFSKFDKTINNLCFKTAQKGRLVANWSKQIKTNPNGLPKTRMNLLVRRYKRGRKSSENF